MRKRVRRKAFDINNISPRKNLFDLLENQIVKVKVRHLLANTRITQQTATKNGQPKKYVKFVTNVDQW